MRPRPQSGSGRTARLKKEPAFLTQAAHERVRLQDHSRQNELAQPPHSEEFAPSQSPSNRPLTTASGSR